MGSIGELDLRTNPNGTLVLIIKDNGVGRIERGPCSHQKLGSTVMNSATQSLQARSCSNPAGGERRAGQAIDWHLVPLAR